VREKVLLSPKTALLLLPLGMWTTNGLEALPVIKCYFDAELDRNDGLFSHLGGMVLYESGVQCSELSEH